ncbi:hypothetical protein SAMN05192533_10688 [Mesobacillus persicus]|uniref:YpoC-like domain-containing protein n=1 Tax=Mesobacillus persicus TaxID=930146 RepID=A0A1H8BMP6_9BACI|nr:hypothetical protein [Mesobacillus persicus]SEM83779.1 hypothetical protein SAMN05192533_10688 [Mesobacillus persicus]
MGKYFEVPIELQNSFFFPECLIEWEDNLVTTFNPNHPFQYELGYYAGMEGLRPWETPEEGIPLLLKEWKKIKGQLEELFATRKTGAAIEPMKQSIALFVEILFWTNKGPVRFPLMHIEELKIKPVNVIERLEFIIAKPQLYHSYIQLSELLIEQEKHFIKERLLKMNSKNVQE